jgi:septation ring formation regulator EzrA
VPEKNERLVAMVERADRLMEKRRTSRIPVSLADLEDLKNLVHEAAELGQKARFLWLSADERADNLAAQVKQLEAELDRRTEDLAFLERATLPDLRREIEHHKAGKQRWRERAETAETRLSAVLDLCDREQRNAIRWENPIPAPEWVAIVQKIALGDSKPETGGAA